MGNSCKGKKDVNVNIPKVKWILKDDIYHHINGNIWTGEIKDDKPEGKGIYIYKNGDRYEGEVNNGLSHGKGIWINNKSGDKYEGEWKNDRREGRGIYYWSNGNKYEGEWEDDKRKGFGICKFISGSKYEGKWEGGMYNGYGIFIMVNPSTKRIILKYEGTFANNLYGGEGVIFIYREDGSTEICRGTWKNGKRHGFCRVELIENNENCLQLDHGMKKIFYEGFYHEGCAVPPK